VAAQVALTVVLLVVAGLLARTFASLTSQAPGFRTAGVATVRMHVPQSRYTDVAALNEFYRRVLEDVRAIPGVQSVALANNLPISRGNASRQYVVAGRASASVGIAQYGVVSDDYFRTLGIPLVAGRSFESRDRDGAPRVAIIDESMQRAVWPHEDAIGKRFRFDDADDSWLTVVGVARDTRGSGLASGPRRGFYIPFLQRPANHTELAVGHDAVLLVSASSGVDALSRPLRDAIWSVDRAQPVPAISTLDDVIADGIGPQRFHATLLGAFASIAIVLVVTGIYGVVAYVVHERAHEFGIRMAMGATARDILTSVLRWGARLTALGLVLGVLAALAVSRYLAGFLFGVTPTDPATMAGAVALISIAITASCLVPAVSAAGTDPASALRGGDARTGRDMRRHRRLPHG
jgi:putative ABC transport system permease protein